MVTQFVIDPMHTADGGVLKLFLEAFVNKPLIRGPITPSIYAKMNNLINCETFIIFLFVVHIAAGSGFFPKYSTERTARNSPSNFRLVSARDQVPLHSSGHASSTLPMTLTINV